MFIRKFRLFDDTAGAAGGSNADAGAAAAAASAAPAAGDAGAAAAGAAAASESTVLASAASAAAAAGDKAAPAAGANDWIPEKFRVMKEDGTMDIDASARKVEEHRSHLEKRLGAGDIPPKSADDYKITIPESLAGSFKVEDLAADPLLKTFMSDAHAAGMTQKQVDMVLGQYLERLPAVAGAYSQLKSEECTAALKEAWKSEAEYSSNIKSAFNAAKAYGGEDFDGILSDYGNDPRIIKLLSNIGKELGEDRSAVADAAGVGEADAQSLQKTPAYWDANHPDHAKTVAKVQAFYQKTYGDKPKQSASMFVGTL